MEAVNELEVAKKYRMDECSISFDDDIDFAAWDQAGMVIAQIRASSPWWIADWLLYGESKWGEAYAQAEAITRLEYGTLAHYRMVARKIPPAERVKGASFSHHRLLINLPAGERRKLLEDSVSNNWSSRDIKSKSMTTKEVVKEVESVEAVEAVEDAVDKAVCDICRKPSSEFVKWNVCKDCCEIK